MLSYYTLIEYEKGIGVAKVVRNQFNVRNNVFFVFPMILHKRKLDLWRSNLWNAEFNKPGSAQVGAKSKAQKYQKDFKMSKYW